MSVDVKDSPDQRTQTVLYYSAASIKFAREMLRTFEEQLKARAVDLASEAGRETVSEEDMMNAALDLLKSLPDDIDESSAADA